MPAPYYLNACNRLISSLSFTTQFLQTTRKRLYSDNSIQSSAYIKLPYSFPPTDKLFPATVWLTAVNLTLLDLVCLFVCLSWLLLLLLISHYRSCDYIVKNVLCQFKIGHIHACMYQTFSMRPIYGPLAHSANTIFSKPSLYGQLSETDISKRWTPDVWSLSFYYSLSCYCNLSLRWTVIFCHSGVCLGELTTIQLGEGACFWLDTCWLVSIRQLKTVI